MQPAQMQFIQGYQNKKERLARELVFQMLRQIQHAHLTLVDLDGETYQFGLENADLKADMVIYHAQFFERVLREGSIGAAEAYIDAWWSSSDLTAFIRIFSRNISAIDAIDRKMNGLIQIKNKFNHWLNRNHKQNARSNIAAHYDLGNDLYRHFLDEKMIYSSAIYHSSEDTLEIAQIRKMKQLCELLKLKPEDHLLEIGTGWGGFAIFAAQNYGCHVTTTTISEQQYQLANEKIQAAGLSHQIRLLKQDYRDLKGEFDKIISIEMIEAVGQSYLNNYVHQCYRLLKPNGLLALQSITIADSQFDFYSNHVDFIQKHIFPGGFLPSISFLIQAFSAGCGFALRDLKDIGLDYAWTIEDWHERLEQNKVKLAEHGYDERFMRLWRFYFCYCRGGFLERSISAAQLLFQKPQWS